MRTASRGRGGIGAFVGIAVAALVVASGCSGSSATPPIVYITPTPGTGTPLPSGVTPEPLKTATIDTVVISTDAPDKKWKVTFKKPVISGISDGSATKVNDAITALVNGYINDFTGSSLPAVAAGAAASTLEGDFTVALNAPDLISLRFTLITHVTGAASIIGKPGSINVSVASGAKIGLADLFTSPSDAVSALASQTNASLSKQLGTELTWDGKASAISFFEKAWVMTAEGLEFNFDQGSLASDAAGMPSVTLPWSGLKSLIKPTGPAGGFTR